MKREDIQKAMFYDNLITRYEKFLNHGKIEGLGTSEVCLLIDNIGFDKIEPLIKEKIGSLEKEIEEL